MDTEFSTLARLSDDDLLARVRHLAQRERELTSALVAHLTELDERRLYLAEGCSSLFGYCTEVLHLSEHAAYGRIEAARAARRYPTILARLASGSVTLTTVKLLAPHLTPENHRELLDTAQHRSKRQVEELVANVRPQPAVPASIRKLPTRTRTSVLPEALLGCSQQAAVPGSPEVAPPFPAPVVASVGASPARARVVPLAAERYKVQFTASAETYDKLRRTQDLLRHQIPDGDLSAIFDRALTVLLADLAKKKLAATDRPRAGRATAPDSRHIPAAVKRAVWKRDDGRCAFVSQNGRRCAQRGFLEFHHDLPHGDGGEPTLDNIQLRCRAHNQYEAKQYFGPHRAPGEGGADGREASERKSVARKSQTSYSLCGHARDGNSFRAERPPPGDEG